MWWARRSSTSQGLVRTCKAALPILDDRPHGGARVINYVNSVDAPPNGIINFVLEIFNLILIMCSCSCATCA
ncbi:MAG: hypothetical protein ACLRSY_01045 [Acutalibacter sp.]